LHDVSRAVPSLPISRRPNPSLFGRVFVPMPRHPDGIHARALFPMAGCPEPMVIAIIPVSRHPDVGLARSGSFHLRPQRWRLLPHHHRSRRRCRDGFRGHDHGLMIMRSAPAQYRCAHHHQRQNAKRNYFLHKFFPLGWRGQPWFFAIPANGLRNISSMAGKGRWGTLLLWSGGIFPKAPGVPPSSDRVSHLSFLNAALFSAHADLRVSLRKVRERQRNPHPLQRLERRQVPPMRFHEAREEIFRFRFRQCRARRCRAGQRRRWRLRQRLWLRKITSALRGVGWLNRLNELNG
jgi:hypothetical protein